MLKTQSSRTRQNTRTRDWVRQFGCVLVSPEEVLRKHQLLEGLGVWHRGNSECLMRGLVPGCVKRSG